MDYKKKMKNFFTLTRKANDGFTLVELIVVIAILAILAGVAVPVYSGYIKKAKRAADEQLLGAVNTAFAAACAYEGQNHIGRSDVSPLALNNGVIPAAYVFANAAIDSAFDGFYEGGTFKVIDRLIYDAQAGAFKDPATAETLVLAYGGGFVKVTGEAIIALTDSTYYSLGSDKLLNQVNMVASIAGGMGSVLKVQQTEGYINAAMKALGLTPTGNLVEDGKLLDKRAEELAMAKLGYTEKNADNQTAINNLKKQISDNALVIYTAQSTTQLGTEEAKKLLDGINSDMIRDAMDGKLEVNGIDKATGMNQAALAYGMYYAYVNSDACTKNLENTNIVPTDVIKALDENDEFRAYINSDQGTKDMEAYLKALEVVHSSSESKEAVETLVVNGFNDPDLIAILKGTMGN